RFNHNGKIGVARRVQRAVSCGPAAGRPSYRTSEVVPSDRQAGLLQELASGCVDGVLACLRPAARREPQSLSAIRQDYAHHQNPPIRVEHEDPTGRSIDWGHLEITHSDVIAVHYFAELSATVYRPARQGQYVVKVPA